MHYRGMIGSLLYLTASGLDLQLSVGICARFQSNPKQSHLNAIKRILRYLIGTANLGLRYEKVLFAVLQAMKHGHTKLIVCTRVWHKWDTDARWTPVRHVSDTRSYVSHLKNIIFRLGHASDMRRTRLECTSDAARHGFNTTRTQLSTFLIIWWTKKKIQRSKNSSSFKNLFFWDINRNKTLYFFFVGV